MHIPKEKTINAAAALVAVYGVSLACSLGYAVSLLLANPGYLLRLGASPLGWMIATGWMLSVILIALLPFLNAPSDFENPTAAGVGRSILGLICAVQATLSMMFGPVVVTVAGAGEDIPAGILVLAVAYAALAAVILCGLIILMIRRRVLRNRR